MIFGQWIQRKTTLDNKPKISQNYPIPLKLGGSPQFEQTWYWTFQGILIQNLRQIHTLV